jgi:oxygen-independent coproporphyrinogen-3 oxidase
MEFESLRKQIISHDWFPKRSAEYYRWYPKSLHPVERNLHKTFEMSPIEGIYVHIPFCDEICSFCPFNKQITSSEIVDQYVTAIAKEIRLLRGRELTPGLSFIYFGGGSPSVLTPGQIGKLIDTANKACSFADGMEITIEAHPRNCTDEYLRAVKGAGVNRISSGIQSFSDEILTVISATHVASLSKKAVDTMPKYFENWGVDLLYRCPGQTIEKWEEDLNILLEIAPPEHISCYTLSLPDDRNQPTVEEDVELAVFAQARLEAEGYSHYASCATGGFDYAKPSRECTYERRHWGAPQAPYAALGSGAIGFLGGMTTVNFHDTQRYVRAALSGNSTIFSSSTENIEELKRRYMVLGVKTLNISLMDYELEFGNPANEDFNQEFKTLVDNGMIQIDDHTIKLTNLGRYYVDQISEEFWSVAERNTPHPETNNLRAVEQKANL